MAELVEVTDMRGILGYTKARAVYARASELEHLSASESEVSVAGGVCQKFSVCRNDRGCRGVP